MSRFLSTLSLRRATMIHHAKKKSTRHFYPRSPCGERLGFRYFYIIKITHFYPRSPCGERPAWHRFTMRRDFISIHALLAESDLKTPCVRLSIEVFLSTLSLRRATNHASNCTSSQCISIHALLAESDYHSRGLNRAEVIFLSTLSLRRATVLSRVFVLQA